MANADRDRTVSQKANTDPLPLRVRQTNIASQMLTAKKQLHRKPTLTQFPLRVRRHHAAFEGTQPRVVATADDPCFGIGCQPVRLHSLSEVQDLEGHHFTPGPRLNGGVVSAAWAPAGMAVARAHSTRYDVLPVPSVLPGVGASRFFAQRRGCVAPAGMPTADDPCLGVGCQPFRQNNLSESQNLEVHDVMPGPRLNGGVVGAAWPCRDGRSSRSCDSL